MGQSGSCGQYTAPGGRAFDPGQPPRVRIAARRRVAYRARMSSTAPDAAAREQIIEIGRDLHARNLVAAADGNISIKVAPDHILITPSGRMKAKLLPSDLAVIDGDGRTRAGTPSSEAVLHVAVYRHCPAATCVVHAHPPTAVAWTIARPDLAQLPLDCMSEVIIGVGTIPIVPYARPGSPALAEQLAAYLPQHRVMVLARHGALAWGETAEEAYAGMERIEHAAHILHLAAALGELTPLPADELAALRAIRARLGDKSR